MVRNSTAAFLGLLVAAAAALATADPAASQDAPVQGAVAAEAEAIAARTLFVVSGGYWENEGDAAAGGASGDGSDKAGASESAPELPAGRGYYRVVAIRQPDNTSRVFLQQVALATDGPKLVTTRPIEEINALAGYVTDVRQEKSDGMVDQPGLTAYVFIKKDPKETEPDTWTIFVDEYGAVGIEHTSN